MNIVRLKGGYLVVAFLAAIVLGLIIFMVYVNLSRVHYYATEEDCELKTQRICSFVECDVDCGISGYGKGWLPAKK